MRRVVDPAALSQAEIPRAKGMLRMMNVSATGDATNCGRKQVHLDKLWASAEAGPPRKKQKEQELGLSSAELTCRAGHWRHSVQIHTQTE